MGGAHDRNNLRPDTLTVVAGRDPQSHFGFVNPPVHHGSTILFRNAEALRNRDAPYHYGRTGGPGHEALERAIAAIEGGHRTRLAPSGKAAVTLALMAYTSAGDHLLVADNVYTPTRMFSDAVLSKYRVEITYFDPALGGDISTLFRKNTRAVVFESPGSQTFEMLDVPAIAGAARRAGVISIMDNTWASPIYFKPFDHGVDVSIQAATKYIVGHSDVMLGAVTATEEHWPALNTAYLGLGMHVAPDDVYLGQRGLRTLNVRLAQHMKSGIEMAEWLEARPEVVEVRHPALPSDLGHGIWKRDFLGASGLFGFVLKPFGQAAVDAFLDAATLFGMGYSWGGYESLLIPVDPRQSRTATTWTAPGPAFRIHVGLEDTDDLKTDLDGAFAALRAADA